MATETDAPRAALTAWGRPGRRHFGAAAAWEVAATAAAIAQWAALAWVAQAALGRGIGPREALVSACGLLAAGALAALARRAARSRSEAGRRAIAEAMRADALLRVLPDGASAAAAPAVAPAAAATALLEQVDDVAAHLAATGPLHRAAPAAMGLVFAVVAVAHWPVAVILAAASALMPINLRLAGLSAQDASRRRLDEQRRLSAVVLESYRGMATLRALRATSRRRQQIARASDRLGAATSEVLSRAFLSGLVMDAVVTFALAVSASYVGLSLLGYVSVPIAPRLDLFTGLLVLLLCPMYFLPLRRMAAGYHRRDRALAAAEALLGLGVGVEPAAAPGVPAVPAAPATLAAGRVAARDGSAERIEVRGLAFGHPGAAEPVLDGVELTAAPGEWTAVTGPSGAGKTTLLSLLAGLRAPTAGSVAWVDPETGAERLPALAEVGWIGQATVVIEGTLADNIRLGRPGASDADVAEAASAAGLDGLLARLPAGLDAPVGDGGAGVSAGEARRIAIARALLKGARVWLLDEPTAHLDPETEVEVLDALRLATVGASVVVATHSPVLLRYADARYEVAGRALLRQVVA